MSDTQDIELLIKSNISIIHLESAEERRVLEMFRQIAWKLGQPLSQWTVTDGLPQLDVDFPATGNNTLVGFHGRKDTRTASMGGKKNRAL